MTFALCIQARLGSTRLPGKVLKTLHGKTMLERILIQVKACQTVSDFVLTTSKDPSDDPLVEKAQELGMKVFRSDVDDIIGRLAGSLAQTSCDGLIRIWGDCPFVCPDVIDAMALRLQNQDLDFINNSDIEKRTFPPGLDLEVYRRVVLEEMNQQVTDPKLREFPFEFVKKNKGTYRYELYTQPPNLAHVHLTVDYPEDLAAAEKLYAVLSNGPMPFHYPDLLKVIQNSSIVGEFSHQARNIEYQQYLAQRKAER